VFFLCQELELTFDVQTFLKKRYDEVIDLQK